MYFVKGQSGSSKTLTSISLDMLANEVDVIWVHYAKSLCTHVWFTYYILWNPGYERSTILRILYVNTNTYNAAFSNLCNKVKMYKTLSDCKAWCWLFGPFAPHQLKAKSILLDVVYPVWSQFFICVSALCDLLLYELISKRFVSQNLLTCGYKWHKTHRIEF